MLEAASAEEEAADDPAWREDAATADRDEDGDMEDAFPEPEPPRKKRRKEKGGQAVKVKCPHCFREFTNLKHHINQQHAQVCSNKATKHIPCPTPPTPEQPPTYHHVRLPWAKE